MKMNRNAATRPGIALVVSILGLVVVGALVGGVLTSAVLEQRVGENTRRQQQAFAVAEVGAVETVAAWQLSAFNSMPIGTSTVVSGTTPAGTGTYEGTVWRLNDEMFMVTTTGLDAAGGARQRVGVLVKLRILSFDVKAALTTRGPGTVGGNAAISGDDHVPWGDCPPAVPPLPGLRHPDPSELSFVGQCGSQQCVTGESPAVREDDTVTDETFFNYGDADWAALAELGTLILPGGTYQQIWPTLSGTLCNPTNIRNWGEPRDPAIIAACRNYFPVVYVDGDLTVNTGVGQGVLLVNGDLTVNGSFSFYGIVIVRGQFRTQGTGNHFNGGVLAANVDLDNSAVLGSAVIQYSSCAVRRASTNAAVGSLLRSRGWVQAF